MTQRQQDIITDLVIDNGLIFQQNKLELSKHDARAGWEAHAIMLFNHSLFMKTVYDHTIDNADYVNVRLTELLLGIARYREQYEVDTVCYKVFNSFYDRTIEAFIDFYETIYF